MRKILKNNKGITLIALIITIIILLILAVVSINLVTNSGIIKHAENATNEYKEAEKDEQEKLLKAEYEMAKYEGKFSGSYQDYLINKKYPGVKVGDYVDYKAGVGGYSDTNGWKVLGIENGELLLVSSDNVGDLELKGIDGSDLGVAKLKTKCEPYGKGNYSVKDKARSINADDINKITGYNPATAENDNGTIKEYGKEVTFTLTADGKIAYTDGDKISETSSFEIFKHPNGTMLKAGDDTTDKEEGFKRVNEIKVRNNAYRYNSVDLKSERVSIEYTDDNEAYKMLFGTDYTKSKTPVEHAYSGKTSYWLATPHENATGGDAIFGMGIVGGGFVDLSSLLWYSGGIDNPSGVTYGVRAVVYLESNAKLTSAGANSWTLS